MTRNEKIEPIQPEGLKPIPRTSMPVKPDVVKIPESTKPDDSVGWFDLLLLWVKTNFANDIVNFFRGGVSMESKLWYASKTLWMNVITLVWTFVGPSIGITVLDTETMVGILAVVNLVLRILTKKPVTLT